MQLWTGQAGFSSRTASSEALVYDEQAEKSSMKAMLWLLDYSNRSRANISVEMAAVEAGEEVEKDTKKRAVFPRSLGFTSSTKTWR